MAKEMSPGGRTNRSLSLTRLLSTAVLESCCVPQHHSRNTNLFLLNLSLNSSFTIAYNLSTKAKRTGRAQSLSDSLVSESWKHQTNTSKHHHWSKSTSITQVHTKSKTPKLKAGRSSLCANTALVSLWSHSDKWV